jgi:hypothetical protein
MVGFLSKMNQGAVGAGHEWQNSLTFMAAGSKMAKLLAQAWILGDLRWNLQQNEL